MEKRYSFTVVLEPAEEGGYLVLVPALPEVVTHGATKREALAMARDAIRLALDYRHQQGEPIPAEKPPELQRITVAAPA